MKKGTILTTVLTLLVVGLFSVQPAMAFQTVTGEVVDQATGETLPGVNIVVQGTQTGTSTDSEGLYELDVPSLQDTLIFTFIGYQRQVIPINGRTTINVTMISQTLSGEEVVVVGYGTQERRQITGSVTSVKEGDFVANTSSASEMIQGKVPGLQISTRSGNPNDNPTIRLRGISSFSANQEPLVVIDGVIGASLDNVDPNDIESIDVLKDASASAIYGTRGSAGVILVTTKDGTAGRENLAVNYNGYYSVEGIENRLDVLSADEYRQLSQETGFAAPDLGADTDWFEEISQTGQTQVHNLALSGGTQNMNYRVSGNFRDREGIQRYTGFQHIGGRLNITQWALDQKLQVTANLAASNREHNFGFADAFKFAGIMNPTSPVKADGFENTGGYFEQPLFNYYNPVAIIELGEQVGETKYFNGALRAEYEFADLVPNLSVSAFYSLQTTNRLRNNFYSRQHKLRGGATQASLGAGLAEKQVDDSRNELFETTVTYLADLTSELSMEAFAGYSYNDFVDQGTFVSGGDFVSDYVGFDNLTFAQDFDQGEGSVSSYKATHKLIGFFGRANFNYDDTYFVNGSVRREGSTRFGVDNKWGLFWSAGLGVELTNVLDIPALNGLKLRASIGKTGQDARESGIAKQRFAPQAGNFFVNGTYIQAFGPVSNANPDLKWEEKTEINVGLDFQAMDNRLRGSIDAYNSTTSDLLFEVSVPVPPNLYPTTWMNVGELETSGLDVALDYTAVQSTGDGLNWNTGLTFSLFSETMLNEYLTEDVQFLASPGSPGLNTPDMIRIKEGEPIGQLWGPEFSRIGPNGEWLFIDADGNEVTYSELSFPDDEKVLGNGLPDFQLGWTNNINYKNWDFSLFIRGVFGHQLANMFSLFYSVPKQITSYNVLDKAFELTELTEDPRWSSYYVEDADFIRVQNASLGYTFPMSADSPVRRLRAYVSANNLFTITGYSGINPEVRHSDDNLGRPGAEGGTGGALAPGIERRIEWYTARTINIGINLDF